MFPNMFMLNPRLRAMAGETKARIQEEFTLKLCIAWATSSMSPSRLEGQDVDE